MPLVTATKKARHCRAFLLRVRPRLQVGVVLEVGQPGFRAGDQYFADARQRLTHLREEFVLGAHGAAVLMRGQLAAQLLPAQFQFGLEQGALPGGQVACLGVPSSSSEA